MGKRRSISQLKRLKIQLGEEEFSKKMLLEMLENGDLVVRNGRFVLSTGSFPAARIAANCAIRSSIEADVESVGRWIDSTFPKLFTKKEKR